MGWFEVPPGYRNGIGRDLLWLGLGWGLKHGIGGRPGLLGYLIRKRLVGIGEFGGFGVAVLGILCKRLRGWVLFGHFRFGFWLWKSLWISGEIVGFCWVDGLWRSGIGVWRRWEGG